MNVVDRLIAVLIVEDEALIRLDVAAEISEAGFKIYEAGGADQALRLLDENADIRVLFTDLEMPGSMDGLALAHHSFGRSPTIKIIVTSGRRKIEAKDLPEAAVFFSKPYRPAHIVEQLRVMTV